MNVEDLSPEEVEAKLDALYRLLTGRLMLSAQRAMEVAGFMQVAVQSRPSTQTEIPDVVLIRAAGTTADRSERVRVEMKFKLADVRLAEIDLADRGFSAKAKQAMDAHLRTRGQKP